MAIVLLYLVLWLLARYTFKIGPHAKGSTHEHDWQHVATEWLHGKEVHVMVCYRHDTPAIERHEADQ